MKAAMCQCCLKSPLLVVSPVLLLAARGLQLLTEGLHEMRLWVWMWVAHMTVLPARDSKGCNVSFAEGAADGAVS